MKVTFLGKDFICSFNFLLQKGFWKALASLRKLF